MTGSPGGRSWSGGCTGHMSAGTGGPTLSPAAGKTFSPDQRDLRMV